MSSYPNGGLVLSHFLKSYAISISSVTTIGCRSNTPYPRKSQGQGISVLR